MASTRALPYTCGICGESTSLETCKTDENGRIVHEDCYAVVVRLLEPSARIRRMYIPNRKQGRSLRIREQSASSGVLSGWKEIARYLRKGIRTLQRYEREMGLPIHRPSKKSSSAVVAIEAELNDWLIRGPGRVDLSTRLRGLSNRTNVLRADFLRIDSEIALTFSDIALHASDQEKRRRAIQAARNAYDTILRMQKNTFLTDTASTELNANLRRLRSELRSLGQTL